MTDRNFPIIRGLGGHQPWWQLMAIGVKTFETRSWETDYRGWIALYACKGLDAESERFYRSTPCYDWLSRYGYGNLSYLPLGKIVALGRLAEIFTYGQPDLSLDGVAREPDPLNYFCGWYAPGRKIWVFEEARTLVTPIALPAKVTMRRGLFNLPADFQEALWNAPWETPPAANARIQALQGG